MFPWRSSSFPEVLRSPTPFKNTKFWRTQESCGGLGGEILGVFPIFPGAMSLLVSAQTSSRNSISRSQIVRSLQTGTLQTGTLRICEKSPKRPPLRERKGGKRRDPSGKNRRPANSLKNVYLSCALSSKYPFAKYPFASLPDCKHSHTVKRGYRLRVEVRSKNASVSGFTCRPLLSAGETLWGITVIHKNITYIKRGGLFYLRLGLFYLRLVFVTYGGLFCSRLKFGLVFFTYGWIMVWSFLLTVENRFGLFYLRFSLSRELGLVFFTYGSPTVSKKDEP